MTWKIWQILSRALEILKSLQFNGLFLIKVYNVWAKKVQRSYVRWHWRLIQNLKQNWLVLSKMTWRIWQIFVHRLKNGNFILKSRMAEQNPNKNSKQPDGTDAVWKLYVKWIAQLTKRFTHSTESMFLRYEKIFKNGVNSLSVGERGHRKFCWGEGGNFFTCGWEPQEEWFW